MIDADKYNNGRILRAILDEVFPNHWKSIYDYIREQQQQDAEEKLLWPDSPYIDRALIKFKEDDSLDLGTASANRSINYGSGSDSSDYTKKDESFRNYIRNSRSSSSRQDAGASGTNAVEPKQIPTPLRDEAKDKGNEEPWLKTLSRHPT